MRGLDCIVFLVVIGSATSACAAQQPAACDMAHLWKAETSGVWEQNKSRGYFRAVLSRIPGEPAEDSLCVQIIESRSNGEMLLKRSIGIGAIGYRGAVSRLNIASIPGNRAVVSIDIEMRGMEGIELREVYVVGLDGSVIKVAEARYSDLGR
jgi:hypothetical protein